MKHLISFLFVFAFTASAAAGEITRSDAYSDFEWKSTECAKPIPKPDAFGLTAQDRLMAYARDIEVYIECIQREAQSDFDKAQTKMHEAVQKDVQKSVEVMNDMMLNAAKTIR